MQAFRTISSLEGFEGPVAPNDVGCLPKAQTEVALNDIFYGLSLSTTASQLVKKEKAGPVEMEYFDSGQAPFSASTIPQDSVACLKTFGWKGFTDFTGLSTLRHHR